MAPNIDNHHQLTVVTIDDRRRYRPLALSIVENAKPTDLKALHDWAAGLVEIRDETGSVLLKAKAALALTLASKVVWPAVKMVATATKRYGWDERSRTGRMAIVGAGAGLALFGGANAGIAALGTAIGVPLWVVTGSGAAFANVLIEEIRRCQAGES